MVNISLKRCKMEGFSNTSFRGDIGHPTQNKKKYTHIYCGLCDSLNRNNGLTC